MCVQVILISQQSRGRPKSGRGMCALVAEAIRKRLGTQSFFVCCRCGTTMQNLTSRVGEGWILTDILCVRACDISKLYTHSHAHYSDFCVSVYLPELRVYYLCKSRERRALCVRVYFLQVCVHANRNTNTTHTHMFTVCTTHARTSVCAKMQRGRFLL